MHILSQSANRIASPGSLWAERVQSATRLRFDEGHFRLQHLRAEEWPQLKAEWQAVVKANTAAFLEHIGEPVTAELLKETRYNGFRVQNIVFESVPGWKVGLNLFLPLTDGPYTPIICPCGHGAKWLDDHQIPPQVLARSGFAAALFDMPMFGEKQRDNDHFIQGSQAGMAGLWSNFFFLIDALRSADYLQSRADITFERGMGVTGVSGGGFATLFMAQIDPRVRAIAPVCSVASFGGHVIEGLYTGCPENYMRGQATSGLDFDHLLCLAAPMPCLVIGGTQDELFRQDKVQQAYDQARSVYGFEGVPERLALFFDQSPHKYTARMANETAKWMRHWLLNDDTATEIKDIALLSEQELDCGTAASTEAMLHFTRREVARLRQAREVSQPRASGEDIADLFDVDVQGDLIEIEPIAPAAWGNAGLRKYILHIQNDLPLPMLVMQSKDAPVGNLLCLTDGDKFELLRAEDGLFGLRRRIATADLRGFGELKPDWTEYDMYFWCGIDRAISDLLALSGETAMGQQIEDALRALDLVDAINSEDTPEEGITIYGRGEAALPALFAGLLHPGVSRIVLDQFLCCFESLATAPKPAWLRYQYVPDVLNRFDLPELFAQHGDKQFLLLNPLDANKQPLDEIEALRLYGLDAPHVAVRVDYGPANLKDTLQAWLSATPEADPEEAPAVDPTLALRGGKPVREKLLPPKMLGAEMTGLAELRNVKRAIGTKTLFRHYGLGKPVMAETLEQTVREKFGVKYAVGVTSGSAALSCALAGLGVGPGDEVILPAFSWFSCYNAIVQHGALPVFCDIDRSLNLDPADFERHITPRTRAVIAVHYQGSPADLDAVCAIARRHGVRVLEDCAQAIGAQYHGRYLGTLGDVGSYSFQGNKVVTAGEGGMVVTDDPLVFERAVRYHDLGHVRPTFAAQLGNVGTLGEFPGTQYRMNELTAAVMLAQIERLDWIVERCRKSWCAIRRQVRAAAPGVQFRISNDEDGDAGITVYLDLGAPARAKTFAEAIVAEGIPTGPSSGMTNLLSQDYILEKRMPHGGLPPFGAGYDGEHVTYSQGLAPNADPILESMVAIGIGPRFTPRDARDVADAIIKVLRSV